ncbi:MAG TPA: MoaD/ThiS family protein [Gemmatimonadaceae bacterium]|nr:MoaD/ThiS family protein [Gemmatimonadaceae bacterium]
MTITTLLFASYADALGIESLRLDLPEGATVDDALEQLRTMPGGERLPPAPLVAINLAYARTDSRLSAGDELAVIPPVAGG